MRIPALFLHHLPGLPSDCNTTLGLDTQTFCEHAGTWVVPMQRMPATAAPQLPGISLWHISPKQGALGTARGEAWMEGVVANTRGSSLASPHIPVSSERWSLGHQRSWESELRFSWHSAPLCPLWPCRLQLLSLKSVPTMELLYGLWASRIYKIDTRPFFPH